MFESYNATKIRTWLRSNPKSKIKYVNRTHSVIYKVPTQFDSFKQVYHLSSTKVARSHKRLKLYLTCPRPNRTNLIQSLAKSFENRRFRAEVLV